MGRASKGVKIMNLNDGDRITGAVALIEVKTDDKDDAENASDGEVTDVVTAETSSNDGNVTEESAEVTDTPEA